MSHIIKGRPVIGGVVEGEAVVSPIPITYTGGISPYTGEVIDMKSPIRGMDTAGKIFIFPSAKGSSGFSKVCYATYLSGKAPAAIVVNNINPQIASGAIAMRTPLVTDLEEDPCVAISTGDIVRVDGTQGTVEIIKRASESKEA